MISKHKIKYKNGTVKTNVRIVEGYRPTPGAPPKQRQLKHYRLKSVGFGLKPPILRLKVAVSLKTSFSD